MNSRSCDDYLRYKHGENKKKTLEKVFPETFPSSTL